MCAGRWARTMKPLFSALCAVAFVSFAGLSGCTADTSAEEDTGEELVEESEDALTGSPSNYGYFKVTRRDFRKCISPICGGWYVKRVNEAKTRCADGSLQAECYVSSIGFKGIGLSVREEEEFRAAFEGGKALVKARTYKTKFNGLTIGTLKANEGWLGATGSDPQDSSFFRVAFNGIVCITAPCPSQTAYWLNSSDQHDIVSLHLDNTAQPASQEMLDRAANALGTKEGILVAGGLALPKCLPSAKACGPFVSASEFYVRVIRRENKSCGGHVMGPAVPCNPGQYCNWKAEDICGAADASGVCSYKPEFCTKIWKPVCACDGNTYGNECMAAAAGYSVSMPGACAAPAKAP